MNALQNDLSSATMSPGTDAPSWLCPKLRAITFWKCVSSHTKLLLWLIEARAEGSALRVGDDAEVGGYGVVPIEELHVEKSDTLLDEEAFATIQSLLGSNAVWVRRHVLSGWMC